jgi:hypothetical protein
MESSGTATACSLILIRCAVIDGKEERIMFEELGISGGTAIIVLVALYFIIKSAVKNGIKAAYRDITGKKAVSDVKTEQKLKEAGILDEK